MKILFLTYDGLTDPLGQSQVLTYMKGLAKRGYDITIVSTEKKGRRDSVPGIREVVEQHNIKWKTIRYTKNPPVISTVYDYFKMLILARKLCRKEKYDIIHCRSYFPAMIGMHLKKFFGVKFIFDMRGFYADERIDGRIWKQRNLIYRVLYHYFKWQERRFLANASYTICLTERARKEILSWRIIPGQPIPIQVIPCCANTIEFDPKRFTAETKKNIREKLEINESDFLLTYTGAIGTWYMLDEMLDFFKRLLLKMDSKFLFITYDDPENILGAARSKQIDEKRIRIAKAKHSEVPMMLSICDLSIFFIRPLYSKMASSPAKQGEILSMGIPIITNSNIGDSDTIIRETDAGMIIRSFTDDDYDFVVSQIPELMKRPKSKIRETAIRYFALEAGVEKYHEVYQNISNR